MKIRIYDTFREFKENYFADFTNQDEYNFYSYLNYLSKIYFDIHHSLLEEINELYNEEMAKEWKILEELEKEIPADAYLLLFHDLWADYCNEKEEIIFANPNLFCEIVDFCWTEKTKNLIYDFFAIKKIEKGFRKDQQKLTLKYLKFIKFIEEEKKEIERSIKRPLNFLGVNEGEIFEIPENDYSGKNELSSKEKLIVLDKLGITDLLKKKLADKTNATHLAEIIGSITGIDNTKGTLTGYCNFLIRPDHSDKNSPYFSEKTENKALQIFNTFKLEK